MGEIYANGEGVPQDDAAAATWYRKAAEQGDGNAQFNLGVLYQAGQGVPQGYVQAYTWFHLAAARFPASETARSAGGKGRD